MVDEISMVSAKLLAQIDTKLRSLVHLHGTYKQGADGMDRPFGGLDVLFVGEFFQPAKTSDFVDIVINLSAALRAGHPVSVQHIHGHSGHPWN